MMTLTEKLTKLMLWAKANERTFIATGVHAEALCSLWPWIERVGAKTVLDCACGPCPGPLATLLAEKGVKSTGIDARPEADVQGDVHDLPFEDRSFDLVMSREGPEHFLIPYLAIAEMGRVSRKWLIICVPSDTPHCADSPGHLYVMGKQGWENVFYRMGLNIEEFSEFDLTETEGREQYEWRWLLKRAAE